MQGKKYISFALLISFSILIVHNIIPHHHHISGLVEYGSEKPDAEGDHHQHSKSCCHAFNELAFNKNGKSIQNLNKSPEFEGSLNNIEETRADETCSTLYIPIKVPGYSHKTGAYHFLRGPPVASNIEA